MIGAISGFEPGFAHLCAWTDADLEGRAAAGLPWSLAVELARSLEVGDATLADWLDADVSELRAGAADGRAMAPTQAYLLLFIARLVGLVGATGDPLRVPRNITPGARGGRWLQHPNDELQGRTPAEFLCTPSRRRHLVDVLGRMDRIERSSGEEAHDPVRWESTSEATASVDAHSVPPSFPRLAGGAVPGAQPKLLCRVFDGRYVAGPTEGELAERHAACCDLVIALVQYTERKQREFPNMDRSTLLRKVTEAVVAKGFDFSPAELGWVMERVEVSLAASS